MRKSRPRRWWRLHSVPALRRSFPPHFAWDSRFTDVSVLDLPFGNVPFSRQRCMLPDFSGDTLTSFSKWLLSFPSGMRWHSVWCVFHRCACRSAGSSDQPSFAQSCRAAYSLEETAAFWKLLVQDLARRRPLPIPLWDDPFGLFTASALRALVRHAIKIERTFCGKEAKPVSTSMMQLPRNFDLHTVLSGTSIALLHNTQTGKLMCKDLVTGNVSAQMETECYILRDSDFSVSRGAAKIVFRRGATEEENLKHVLSKLYLYACEANASAVSSCCAFTKSATGMARPSCGSSGCARSP
jgi:hypothetical protein